MSTLSLIQALPEAWRSTNGLAILGSLGIHALLMAVLPFAALDPDSIDSQNNTIGVVELSPEEQSRIPQIAADPTFMPLPNAAPQAATANQGFQSEILPPLPAPPPFLPPPPGVTSMYQLPSSDSLPPPAPVPLPPPPQNSSLLSQNPFGQPPVPPLKIAPLANSLPSVPGLPPTQALQPSPPLNEANPPEPDSAKPELMARQNALAQKLAAKNNDSTASPQSDRERILEAASQHQLQRAKEREERASRLAAKLQQQSSANSATPLPAAKNPNDDRAARLAAVLQQRQASASPTPKPTSNNQNSDRVARLAALQARLARPLDARPDTDKASSSAQTIAQIEALQQQYQKAQQAYPHFVTAPPIRKRVPVCNQKLNGSEAIIAALTDTTGKIVVGPDVISQDSPSAVQQAAIRYVKQYSFAQSATPVNQTFRLEFSHEPNLCSKK